MEKKCIKKSFISSNHSVHIDFHIIISLFYLQNS